jgi:acyl-coenzyme A synthetase/AMP-(fatty) acid ligase/3-hydroxymyristoyl/3-hydroxydecanoyl-(acyl carrier protein) dehydratase
MATHSDTSQPRSDPWELLARHGPDDLVAWSSEHGALTATDLRRHAASVVRQIPATTSGEEVLILCRDRYTFTVGALAAWATGHVIILPPNLRANTVSELARRRNVRVVLHDGNWEGGVDLAHLLTAPATGDLPTLGRLLLRDDQPIATLITSGSTGERRDFTKLASQLLGEAELLGEVLCIRRGDRLLASVPPQHIYGLLVGILIPLMHGASMFCDTPLLAEEVAALARQGGATVLVSVPAHLRALAGLAPRDLDGLRLIVSSSSPLEAATAAQIGRFPARAVEIFGSTETGGIALRESLDDRFRPLPGVFVAASPDGILLLDSPFLDPRAPRPYVAADRIAPCEGGFRHLGRTDSVLKIAGRRVALPEVEERLRAIEGVTDASVTAVEVVEGRGHEIWALAVAPSLDAGTIRRELLDWLDPVMVPRRLRVVSAIPREPTGKLPLERWHELFGESPGRGEIPVESRRESQVNGADLREVHLSIPVDLPFFAGHFEGYPVLPGVVILNDIALAESQRAWPELTRLRTLEHLKLRRPVRPGDVLTLRLTRARGTPSVEFELLCSGKRCAVGTLTFATVS